MNKVFKLQRNLPFRRLVDKSVNRFSTSAATFDDANVVSSSCKDVDIPKIQLDKFVLENSSQLHANKLALVSSQHLLKSNSASLNNVV